MRVVLLRGEHFALSILGSGRSQAQVVEEGVDLVDCCVQQESCKYKCFHIFPISIDQRYWKEHLTFEDFHISKKIPKAKSYQMHHGLISSFFQKKIVQTKIYIFKCEKYLLLIFGFLRGTAFKSHYLSPAIIQAKWHITTNSAILLFLPSLSFQNLILPLCTKKMQKRKNSDCFKKTNSN